MENLLVEKLVNEGYGLSHNKEGKAVFVPKSVPGDLIEPQIIKIKKGFVVADIKKVVKPSKLRVEPPCPYFGMCGGCQHQNISYDNQLKYKQAIFKEIVTSKNIKTKIYSITPCPNQYHYRNVMRFAITGNKHIKYEMKNHNYGQKNIEITQCLLQSQKANIVMEALKKALNISVSNLSSLWQLRIREGKTTGEMMVEIMTDSHLLPQKELIVESLSHIKEVVSIYHTYSHQRSLYELTRKLIYGKPIIYEKIGKFTFQISPESFFQTNSIGIKTLFDLIKGLVNLTIGETLLDLYCGTGTIGIYLSTLAKRVVGVELAKEAVIDAKDNARLNKVHNCQFISQDAKAFFHNNKEEFENIIVDPPREGLKNEVIKALCKMRPKRLVYVSCNPSTFARDIKEFDKYNWNLIEVHPIDMFPQTHHIECVGLLKHK